MKRTKYFIPTSLHFHKLFQAACFCAMVPKQSQRGLWGYWSKFLILICCSDFSDYEIFPFPCGTDDKPEALFSETPLILSKRYFYFSTFSTEKKKMWNNFSYWHHLLGFLRLLLKSTSAISPTRCPLQKNNATICTKNWTFCPKLSEGRCHWIVLLSPV